MTSDIIALVRNEPDIPTVVEGMIAFGEALRMVEAGPGARHLYDPEGRLLVSIEAPELVRVPGEVERLLGTQPADGVRLPAWWVEVRAAAGMPEARRIARRFAQDIVHWQGGMVWPAEETR
ncbi:hypothetical protein [Actinoallomurus iriomotensis]|uniref:Uncharacterized protein n=1 Tax=Actinoallomurus iriomotensis TaxID=478107 RepID=A0A9W6RYJ5_9ACTN|nr:hypothetical protein [Actinoallomurus iriomotensis]GLY83953.1 hypothetical protein Airi02_018820 [Actinoallomurus iriomotensis]